MHSVQNYQKQKKLSREQKEHQQQQRQQHQRQRPPRSHLQISGKKQLHQLKEEELRKRCRLCPGGDISFKGVDIKTSHSDIFYDIFIANLSWVLLQHEYIGQFYFEKRNGGGGAFDSDPAINTDTGNKSSSATTPQPPPPPNIKTISILLSFDKLGKMKVFKYARVASSIQSTYNFKYSG